MLSTLARKLGHVRSEGRMFSVRIIFLKKLHSTACRSLLFVAVYLVLVSCQPRLYLKPSLSHSNLESVQRGRLEDPIVQEVIKGALLRLDDTQVRDRPGRRSSFYDYCGKQLLSDQTEDERISEIPKPIGKPEVKLENGDDDQGCHSLVFVSLPISKRIVGLPSFSMNIANEIGEWSTYLGIVPAVFGNRTGWLFAAVQDSSMFVPAAVGYPMFLFESSPGGVIQEMLILARRNIARYRRNDGYNFWLQRPPQTCEHKDHTVTFPNNIPVWFLEKVGRLFLEEPEKFAVITKNIADDQKEQLRTWTQALLDPQVNPHGADAAFNIPNDADDTSAAVAFELLYRAHGKLADADEALINEQALALLPNFRDLGRSIEDGHDAWKQKDSGAFLTWLKEENDPTFSRPGEGVIPRAVNNVDCVVNANALLALGLADRREMPGFSDASKLLARAIAKRSWPECGLYYPQQMIFPYVVSRVYRDANVRSPELINALGILMRDVMDEQQAKGDFVGGMDRSHDLSTALAVVTLLNLGEEVALKGTIPIDEYRTAIRSGLNFLYQNSSSARIRNADTFARGDLAGASYHKALTWKPGIFFASTFWGLVEWRSEAYTIAIVLEAFARYALAFDKHSEGIQGRYRIHIDEKTFGLDLVDKTRKKTR